MNPNDWQTPQRGEGPVTQIEVRNDNYLWRATQQKDKRIWLCSESYYSTGRIFNTYAVHDEDIAGEVRKTIGSAT
jgi:hypothetical protein